MFDELVVCAYEKVRVSLFSLNRFQLISINVVVVVSD